MDRVFLPYQLKMLMPSEMYKVVDTLFAFQKDGIVTYSKKNCEYLHIDQALVEQCIQTAVDKKILEPQGMEGGIYKFKIVPATLEAIRQLPTTDIPTKQLLQMSTEIKFKNEMSQPSTEQLLEEIRVLKEKLMASVAPSIGSKTDDLPW